MLKTLIDYKTTETVTLIPNSGVQFMDFGFDESAAPLSRRSFAWVERPGAGDTVTIHPLERDEEQIPFYLRDDGARMAVDEEQVYDMTVRNALERLDRLWLPFPFFRRSGAGFDDGPTTWARIKVVRLEQPDEAGRTHRVALAFDTLLTPRLPGQPYAAPEETSDATEKIFFAFCSDHRRNSAFMMLPWVSGWLREQYAAGLARKSRTATPKNPGEHWAAYIVLLDVLAGVCPMPSVEFADLFSPYSRREPVGVNLVLDIGNSRMCGVLVEDAPGSAYADVSQTYRLELRDLSRVEHVYSEPFESRIEFAPVDFGPLRHASSSNRNKREAFWWPSPVRVGPEAARLAALTDGTEGASGLSSPKRYLWDGAERIQPWINNNANLPEGAEPQEIRGPMISRLRQDGSLRRGKDMPGLMRLYSRSSLYTLMLAELLIQAAAQINSVDVRKNRLNSASPRVLRQIILTLPTATPLAEQKIMRDRIAAAVALVWDVMGWNDNAALFPKPRIQLDWDEATCTHLVWLFNEIQDKFQGTPREFFDLAADARRPRSGSALRVASIDMGGGTTDLMIMSHEIAHDTDTVIAPRQVFREGFRLAGDDILKELVEGYLLRSLGAAMRDRGILRAESILSDLFGGDREAMSQRERTMRGQLVAQVLARAAVGLLRRYERGETAADGPATLAELLAGVEVIAHPAIAYFEETVRLKGGVAFDLLSTPVEMDPARVEQLIDGLVGPMMRDLCDLVRAYDCDVLLVSGRPSQYAVIQRMIQSSMPVTANRIVPMGAYRVGNWYPFRSSDFRISDPKTTAVTGAMLCHTLSQSVGNMTLQTHGMKMKSTARYIGAMLNKEQIRAEDVLLDNIDLDTGQGVASFEMKLSSPTFIGFRQLPIPRWPASPLYRVTFGDRVQREGLRLPLTVTFVGAEADEGKEEQAREDFSIDKIVDAGGEELDDRTVRCRLQTLQTEKQSEAGYWLDTGVLQVGQG